MKKFLIVLCLALNLQGCIFVVGAAAGAAAAAAVYDHRKVAQVVSDQKATNTAVDQLNMIPGLKENSHINVTIFNHIALLTGEAINASYKEQAENAVKNVASIEKTYNQILIKGPSSPLSRTSDSWITAKIKTQMLATKDLKSGTIKVVTENGAVYLLGIVSQEQADGAVDIARGVSGVQKVVKIFQYKTP
jgi:osmotically-inducible protein OsmY